MLKETIVELIENEIESSYLDFKEKMYPKGGTPDLLKDILAMANSSHTGKRYIIIGVKDRVGEERILTGISQDQIVDSASYQQFILNNIEPDINFDLNYIEYQNKKIAVIEIENTINKPYFTKKKYKNLNEGLCLIRKGSTNSIATRADFNRIYEQKNGDFEIRILDNYLRAVKPKDETALLDVSIRNLTSNPVTIIAGRLLIMDSRETLKTSLTVYGFEKEMGADFRMEVPPKKEFAGDFHFGFTSNDCLLLGLDEYGYTKERFVFKLQFKDSYDNVHSATINDAKVFVKGEFLRKVASRIKK